MQQGQVLYAPSPLRDTYERIKVYLMRQPRIIFAIYMIMVLVIARGTVFVLYHIIETDGKGLMQGYTKSKYEAPVVNDTVPIDSTSAAALSASAFPAQLDSKLYWPSLDMIYTRYDPHRGEIPLDIMALLNSPPNLTAPHAFTNATTVPEEAWKYHPWTRAINGSKTSMEDAMRPNLQPREHDWRPPPHNEWKSPLQDTGILHPNPSEHIQFKFEDPSRFSGKKHDTARDRVLERRRKLVKNAFIRAWQGYKNYAWGADEVSPVSEKPNNNFNGWGATIIDALDTLLVMGLHDEYLLAREHVYDVDFHYVGGQRSAYASADGRIPVFETAIRYLGGLLSAYDLSGDELMRDRAEELAQIILPAFDTLSGLPVGRMRVDDKTEYTPSKPRGYHESMVLAEATSMLMEYTRLWQVTGNRTYFDRVQRVTDFLDSNMTKMSLIGTLLPQSLYPEESILSGKYSFGGGIDSYYEYLVKEHQLLGGVVDQYSRMFTEAMDSAEKHLWKNVTVVPNAPSLVVVADTYARGRSWARLEHLACFSGGMMALGSRVVPNRRHYLNIARLTTESCYWSYNSSLTGLGPENMEFFRPFDKDRYHITSAADGTRHRDSPVGDPFVGVRRIVSEDYRNRPEVIESVLYMWRTTGDPVWQERGWQMFASWMTHCLVRSGVSTIRNVNQVPVLYDDSMESFVFAETFKYYYLLFSPPDLVSLDDFVFTTEAHPFLAPKKGRWARPGDVPVSFPKFHRAFPTFDRPSGTLTSMQKNQLISQWEHVNVLHRVSLDKWPEDDPAAQKLFLEAFWARVNAAQQQRGRTLETEVYDVS